MKLCIPTAHDRGRAAPLSDHFGSAPYFTLVDSETGATDVISNRHAVHAPGSCDAARAIAAHDVEAVVCLGLGRRALASLEGAGIAVFVSGAGTVGGAVDAFRAGRLPRMRAEAACGGGRGHHCG
jgi:predicted Fe-Mo cluster-binding NifX family protein